MSKPELLETLNNCEFLSKKLKLEICNSNITSLRSDTVKCLDVLKPIHSENNEDNEENSNCKLTSISPPFPSRRRLRGVLQNKTNVQDFNKKNTLNTKTKEKEPVLKDATNPGTIIELVSKVPSVQKYFDVKKRIGWGTFSSVFLASEKQTDAECSRNYCALKHIYSCSANTKRVLFETKCLKEIGGSDNVVGLKSIMGNGSEHVLVMPFHKHDRFSTLIRELSLEGVRCYMRNLLTALRRVHKFNVIHRDVKPSNFLYDYKSGSCALVDFGLAHNAHFYKPSKTHSGMISQQRTRTRSVPVSEPVRARSVKHIKKSGSVTCSRSPLHTRSSSMVAMAKNINRLSAVGARKRPADESLKPAQNNITTGTPVHKRLCIKPDMLDLAQCSSERFTGTPRPTFRYRPGFEPRGIPIFLPQASTPSPASVSSERELLHH
uniref:probable serine/threonine-protein kinase cdc7 n=1 Tax=Styela clava TaxID=7725 RepID=UPI001939F742|nr:probable serine/threonine-protein kinase cdc7 [Styela clava]